MRGRVAVTRRSSTAAQMPDDAVAFGSRSSGTPKPRSCRGAPSPITATDANGCLGTRAYEIVIAALGCPPITVNPATLPPATVGLIYSQTITASGGTPAYTFAVTAGALPNGLTLAPGGALTGTPTVAGLFTFTIQATDSLGCLGSRAYSMSVLAPAANIPSLGPLGLVLLMMLLAGAGLLAMKSFPA